MQLSMPYLDSVYKSYKGSKFFLVNDLKCTQFLMLKYTFSNSMCSGLFSKYFIHLKNYHH